MQVFTPQVSAIGNTGGITGVSGTGAAGAGSGAGLGVLGAIRGASSATGTSFDYLLATARVESNLNPQASAKTSSAGGLFQFIDSTWLSTVKQSGASLGYGRYANAITHNSDGSYSVNDPGMRQKIFALRNDPTANAAMAGAFTSANANQLSDKLGRKPTDGELYIAHFMGVNGAAKLITAADGSLNKTAASLFPRAASANKSIFYDKQGQARSASDVYANLIGRYDHARSANATAVAVLQAAQTAQPTTAVAAQATPAAPAAVAPTQAVTPVTNIASAGNVSIPATRSGPLFHNMFSSEQRAGTPVSRVIRDLWATRPNVAAALTGQPSPVGASINTNAVSQVTRSGASDGLGNLYGGQPADVSGMFTSRS